MLERLFSLTFGAAGDERKIGAMVALILVVVAVVCGIAVSAIFLGHINAELKSALVKAMNGHVRTFQWELERAVAEAGDVATRRPHFRLLMARVAAGTATGDQRRQIERIVDNIVETGKLSALVLYDARGQVIASRGQVTVNPPLALTLTLPFRAKLLWQKGYLLDITVALKDRGKRIGRVLMEIPLPRLTELFEGHSPLGKSGDMLVCGPGPEKAIMCFPSRHRQEVFALAREANGQPGAMERALEGLTGVTMATSPGGRELTAAYGPIAGLGLGMVMTIDASEWSDQVRHDLLHVAPVIALLIVLALGLLRWRVAPLVRGVVASRARMRAVLDNAADAIITIDGKGAIESFNPAASRLFGYARDEAMGQNVNILMPEPFRGEHDAYIARYLRDGQAAIVGRGTREVQGRRKDGSALAMDLSVSEMVLNGDRIFIGMARDISERKRAEEELRRHNAELEQINRKLQETQHQLLQSEKMASIGQLAAGVAHEINNPIGYVHSNLGTLEKYLQDVFEVVDCYQAAEAAIADSDALSCVGAAKEKADLAYLREDLAALMKESKEGISRVKKIVQDLKDFSHVDAGDEWLAADLHQGLDSTLNIVWNELKYKVQVHKEYGQIPKVECLPSQINQVFLNLLVNAGHAIEERGEISIRTGREGGQVWVAISDTGKGISPDHISRIFNPFFTTKPVGKGTGLGLSLSYSIVQKHQGRMEVKSEQGKGTTFTVWLPITRPMPQKADGQVSPETENLAETGK